MVRDDEAAVASETGTIVVAQAAAQQPKQFNRPLRWLKIIFGLTSSAGFVYGLRTAWVQARPLRPGELTKVSAIPHIGLALQALGLATLITFSGYVAIVVAISEAMGVNTFKEFGQKATSSFGDRFRISKSKGNEGNYESFSEILEAIEKQSRHKSGKRTEKEQEGDEPLPV